MSKTSKEVSRKASARFKSKRYSVTLALPLEFRPLLMARATDTGVSVAKLLTDIIWQAVSEPLQVMVTEPLQVTVVEPLQVMATEPLQVMAENLITANSKDLTRQLIDLYGGKKLASAGIKELDGFVCGIKSINERHSDRARLLASIQNRISASTHK